MEKDTCWGSNWISLGFGRGGVIREECGEVSWRGKRMVCPQSGCSFHPSFLVLS